MAEVGPDLTDLRLHTAIPNNPDRDIRLDLLGPAAFGSGPSRSKERKSDGWSWLMVVATASGTGGPGRAGINQDVPLWESGVIHGHVPCYRWDTAPLHDAHL